MRRKEGIPVSSDEQLVQQFLSGREEAFRQIVDIFSPLVYVLVSNIVKNESDVADIVQEVFVQAYRSLPRYKPGNFKSWLAKIAVNKAIDWKRARSKLEEDHLQDLNQIVDQHEWSQPEALVVHLDDRRRVRQTCMELPEIYRQVVIKYYFEGKSYQDIAGEEGISLKTVESRLYRARDLFRRRWEVADQ